MKFKNLLFYCISIIFIAFNFINLLAQKKLKIGIIPKTINVNKQTNTPTPKANLNSEFSESGEILDLGIKTITNLKNNFTIVGKKIGARPKWIKVQLFGVNSGLEGTTVDTKNYECKITEWMNNTIKIDAPKNLNPGKYRVQLTVGSKINNMKTKLIVPGMSHYYIEEKRTNNSFGISSTILNIAGIGFGNADNANFVIMGTNKIKKFITWNDTLIKFLIPLVIKKGFEYPLTIKNSKSVEFNENNIKDGRMIFKYNGISNVKVIIPENFTSIIRVEVFGLGFGNHTNLVPPISISQEKNEKTPKKNKLKVEAKVSKKVKEPVKIDNSNSELYLNDFLVNKVTKWTPTNIDFYLENMRSGKYLPKIITTVKNGKNKQQFILYANDSIFITTQVRATVNKIFGSYYALSLREATNLNNSVSIISSFLFTLPEDSKISLNVYDQSGTSKVAGIINNEKPFLKGRYEVKFSSSDLPVGKYIMILEVDKNIKIPYPIVINN